MGRIKNWKKISDTKYINKDNLGISIEKEISDVTLKNGKAKSIYKWRILILVDGKPLYTRPVSGRRLKISKKLYPTKELARKAAIKWMKWYVWRDID